jgi:hypothetical protein
MHLAITGAQFTPVVKSSIDDRSMKVGGSHDRWIRFAIGHHQWITTPEDTPFFDREWDDYPHVIMTSDGEWNPMVLDNIIFTKPSRYAAI